MYCKNCNVKIGCKATHCPLCKHELPPDKETCQSVFAKPTVDRRLHTKFSVFYTIIAAIVIIACIVINMLVDPSFMWSMMVLVCLVYIYYLVRFTFIAQGNFNARIFGQAIVLTIIFFFVRIFVGGNHWIFITWLPIVYFVSEVLLGAYMLINRKRASKNIITVLTLSIMGIIPTIVAFVLKLSVKWPSFAVSGFSLFVVIVNIIVWRKVIIEELKRYFHL